MRGMDNFEINIFIWRCNPLFSWRKWTFKRSSLNKSRSFKHKSVTISHYTLHDNPVERSFQLLCGGSLKSRTNQVITLCCCVGLRQWLIYCVTVSCDNNLIYSLLLCTKNQYEWIENEMPGIVNILTSSLLRTCSWVDNSTRRHEVAMRSPESLVIANFFMEVLEERAFKKVPISFYSFRYVDDVFVIWPHGP
jgi:hypothetical protein